MFSNAEIYNKRQLLGLNPEDDFKYLASKITTKVIFSVFVMRSVMKMWSFKNLTRQTFFEWTCKLK